MYYCPEQLQEKIGTLESIKGKWLKTGEFYTERQGD